MHRDDVESLVGTRLTIGLSTIVGITVLPGQNAVIVKYFSGGSLEIGGSSLTWGAGYLLDTKEVVNVQSSGTFYLAATGSTVTCMLLKGRSSGF